MPADEKEQAKFSDLEEREIIELCRGNGDAKELAWEEIVRRFRRRVFGIAYKFTGRYEESQDLTQEIFLRVFKSLDQFDQNANFGTWLYSVSRNHCIDHYRSGRRERELLVRHELSLEDFPSGRFRSSSCGRVAGQEETARASSIESAGEAARGRRPEGYQGAHLSGDWGSARSFRRHGQEQNQSRAARARAGASRDEKARQQGGRIDR